MAEAEAWLSVLSELLDLLDLFRKLIGESLLEGLKEQLLANAPQAPKALSPYFCLGGRIAPRAVEGH